MPPKNTEMTKEVLQTHCDQIIMKLEKAVQAALYASHLKSNSTNDIQKACDAAKDTKNDYIQTLRGLYSPKKLPKFYTNVYNVAISVPKDSEYSFHNREFHFSESYAINASQIIRQLNEDFLPSESRDYWVSYHKPHLNFFGKVTDKRVSAASYKLCWSKEAQVLFEKKTIYLDIMNNGLFYTVFDHSDDRRAGKISFNKILNLSLQGKPFENTEDALVYAEIKIDAKPILFSVMTEDELFVDTQEQCTAIIDRLIDAVYAEIYREYLPQTTDTTQQEDAQVDACNRYKFYIGTVERLYNSEQIPEIFKWIYEDAIKHANVNVTGNLIRHPIKIGRILSQLNNDFVLKNQTNNIRWLVYNKPYLDFQGNIINQAIGIGIYQPIDFNKHANGLTYRVKNPKGDIQTGELSLDNILALINCKYLENIDDYIYVKISQSNEFPGYDYSFIMHILSHPIVKVSAIALLVIGAALALSSTAIAVGSGMAVVGAGVLMARFFASKMTPERKTVVPDFFTSKYNPVGNDNGTMFPI
jgi:hypothetical protein